jgi:hypothetical protein
MQKFYCRIHQKWKNSKCSHPICAAHGYAPGYKGET